ncbi:MAG: SBBP repeat-containing protein [Candidatus Uhrbacteria bacterium]
MRRFISAISIAVLLFSSLPPIAQAQPISSHTDAGLLQYSSQGHILGFRDDSIYIASPEHMLKVSFLEANNVTPKADERTIGEKIAPLTKVTYENIWDGVTAVYEGSKTSVVKSSYYLDGSKVQNIHLGYNRPIQIDGNGNLVISYDQGTLTESAPIAWQEINGQKQSVTVAYAIQGKNEIGFTLGNFVPGIPVVIDPDLTWNTFLGNAGTDLGYAIVVDGSGNVYIGGASNATWGSPVVAYSAGYDAFVAKLDETGNLIWSTFLGGAGTDYAYGIDTDGSGDVVVTGYSTANWGTPVRAYSSSNDAFVAKLDSSGTRLWNTFLGGAGIDYGLSVAVDSSNNIIFGGYGNASWGSPVRAFTLGNDSIAAKLSSSGSLLWNTFLGGSGADNVSSVAVDSLGNPYVSGRSDATWGSPVRAYTSGSDAFVTKLTTSGALTWNTFLGSTGSDFALGLAVDGTGNAYLAGRSDVTWGTPIRAYTLGTDDYAAKLDSNGALLWNTFLGGSGADNGVGIALDTVGNVYLAGRSDVTWGTPIRSFSAGNDGFAAGLSNNGALLWNTFYGGAGSDNGRALALDAVGNIFLAGDSDASWGAPVKAFTAPPMEAFVAKLSTPLSDSLDSLSTTLAQPMYSADWTTIPSYTNVTYAWSVSKTIEAAGTDPCLTTNDCFKLLINLKDIGTVSDHLNQEWMGTVATGDITWNGPANSSISSVQRVDSDVNGRFDQLQILVDCSVACSMTTSTPYSLTIVNSPIKNPVSPPGYTSGGYTSLSHTMYVNDQSISRTTNQSLISIVAVGLGLTVNADVNPYLTFSVEGTASSNAFYTDASTVSTAGNADTCVFGVLTPSVPAICTWNLHIATNASNGYAIYVVQDQDMTFNGNAIKQFNNGTRTDESTATIWSSPATGQLAHLGYSSNDTSAFAPSGGTIAVWAGIPTIAGAGEAPITTGLVADNAAPGAATYAYAIKVESAPTLPQGTNYTHHEYFMVVGNF